MEELFVDSQDELLNLCARLASSDVIGIDTEFLREKTYYAQLCLIQLATDQLLACVDPLRIANLDPLLELLYQPSRVKILHSARQDLEIFFDLKGELPKPIFDTQVAATLLGYGDQVGYANLVKTMLAETVDKEHTRTDWSQRPLDPAQIHYALNDVRYLIPLYRQQHQRLTEKGREQWLQTDFDSLTNTRLYAPEPQQLWKRVKGANILKRGQLAVLQRLSMWREQCAKELNRPRKWVLPDEVLVDIARRCPASVEALEKIRGWNNFMKKNADAILAVIEQAKSIPESQWPAVERTQPLSAEQESIVDLLMSVVKLRAFENEVTAAVLVTRKELESLVLGECAIGVLSGWRLEFVGNELLQCLEGKKRLSISGRKLVVTDAKNG
ncbi:MAG TPA: ribonuclease D [Gammaproteobacteria bacterium]